MPPAIHTEGLTKTYSGVDVLADLNLEAAAGEVLGYLGPNGAGKTTTIRLLLGLIHPSAGSSAIFGLDSQRHAVDAHKRLAYVPGEANLWPGLTGAETLHLLDQVQGKLDVLYRDLLIERFELDPSKVGPGLLQGQSPEADPDRRIDGPIGSVDPRRTDQRARPPYGTGVPLERP